MKNKPLISVIVPVYKVENYLDRCVKSIVDQSYQNLEIVLVDDGSPDKCGEKCDFWASCDKRIIALHKENGGLSDARNYGTKYATGEYISYIDSDDWIASTYIENLYSAIIADDADMAMCWFEKTQNFSDKEIFDNRLKKYECLSSKSCLEKLLYQEMVDTCAWGKLYSKKLIPLLHYPEGKLYEDIPVTYATISSSSKIAKIENKDYFYFQREDSIQNMNFDLRKLDAIKHIKNMTDDVQKNYPELRKACNCRYFSVLNNILFQISDVEENEQLMKNIWNEIKRYRFGILVDCYARKKARIAAFVSYFGFRVLNKMYDMETKRGRI